MNSSDPTLLIIGNCVSPYLPSIVKALEPHGFKTDLLDPYQGWYLPNGSTEKVHYADQGKKLSQIDRATFLRSFLRNRSYDICNVHYNSVFYGLVAREIDKVADRLVVSIWGGDTYPGWWIRKFQSRLLSFADLVTINNPDKVDELTQLFWLPDSKVEVAFMPLEILNLIDETCQDSESRRSAKRSMGMDSEQTVVLCGTNAWPEQKHLKILESLEAAADSFAHLSEPLYVFPLTYGRDINEYIEQVTRRVDKSPLNTLVLHDYLSNQELVSLRIATDVMLQLQSNDMFSAALQEALFAGSEVITGNWLPYQFLRSEISGLHLIDRIEEAGEKLADLLKTKHENPPAGKRMEMMKFGGLAESGRRWADLLSGKDDRSIV